MKGHTACFTGHRKIPQDQFATIRTNLRIEVNKAIDSGYRFFGAGGALGFDTMAAQTVLELKPIYPQIRLILVLPCLSQADRWSRDDKAIYEGIIKRADKVVYTSKEYTRDCMFKRNRHLVDNSSLCIYYLTKSSGGTAYTVQYAKSKNLQLINLAML